MKSEIAKLVIFCWVLLTQWSFVESESCSAPEHEGCTISLSDDNVVGWIDGETSWYHCLNDLNDYEDLASYEIRIIGAYESTDGHSGFQQHNSGPITVNLESCHTGDDYDFSKSTVLYLASYEPVDWIIETSDSIVESNINLAKIHVASYYADNSSVTIGDNLEIDSNDIVIGFSSLRGYGSDCGGGNTQEMLEAMESLFGNDVYSFIGAYEFDTVNICVGKQDQDIQETTEENISGGAVEGETDSSGGSSSSSSSEDGGRGHGHGCGGKSHRKGGGVAVIGILFAFIIGCILLKCCCRALCGRNCRCSRSQSGCGSRRKGHANAIVMSEIHATNAPRNTDEAPKTTETTTQGETGDVDV